MARIGSSNVVQIDRSNVVPDRDGHFKTRAITIGHPEVCQLRNNAQPVQDASTPIAVADVGGVDILDAPLNYRPRDPKWVPVRASELGPAEAIDWIWRGYAAPGCLSLLTGFPKAGKTTLLSHVLAATSNGGEVATNVSRANVLVVSEESSSLWIRRRDNCTIGDNVRLIMRPFMGRPSDAKWGDFIDEVVTVVNHASIDLVIIDTFSSVSPAFSENDSAAVLAALTPLQRIAQAGAAVLLVHHPRKADGAEGNASRGSNAITGFVDIIIELRRHNPKDRTDSRRKLTTYSRFDETPDELVIELTDGGFVTLGSSNDAKASDLDEAIASVVGGSGKAMCINEVIANWPADGVPCPSPAKLRQEIARAVDAGLLIQSGLGRKGDPFRYRVSNSGAPDAEAAEVVPDAA